MLCVMGWTNSHLHRFVIHGKEYGIAYNGGIGFDDDPRQIRLRDFHFRLRERFLYAYDFGDHSDGMDREQDFLGDDEGEESDEPGYDPEQFDRRAVNAQWRRWGA